MRRAVQLLTLLFFASASLTCREEGPTERVGRSVDEAVEKLKYGDEGTFEKAGRKLDEAIEAVKNKFEKSR